MPAATPVGSAPATDPPAPPPARDPWAALRVPDFWRLQCSRLCMINAVQMMAVAIGFDIYSRTRNPLDLGMIGLVQFLPSIVLIFHTGYLADRLPRRNIVQACQVVMLLCMLALMWSTWRMPLQVWPIYALLFVMGIARAYQVPAAQALMPQLVPQSLISNGVTWNGFVFNFSTIAGPSFGGLLLGYAQSPLVVYACSAMLSLVAILYLMRIRTIPPVHEQEEDMGTALMSGLRFVFRRPLVLGAISLDLFAVLLGGAVALLPAFAVDILHVGPQGLGLLRAAPAVGAMLMGILLTHLPPLRNAGATMLWNVAGFGVATVVFALSRNFWLSMLALFFTGVFDMISVVVRHSMVQLVTPDAMRGRVSAVNNVFIGASNELGEFESGVTAHWFGTVPSVLIGGVGTMLVTLLWAWWFPELRKFKRLDDAVISADRERSIDEDRAQKEGVI